MNKLAKYCQIILTVWRLIKECNPNQIHDEKNIYFVVYQMNSLGSWFKSQDYQINVSCNIIVPRRHEPTPTSLYQTKANESIITGKIILFSGTSLIAYSKLLSSIFHRWTKDQQGGVAIPTHFFKVITRCSRNMKLSLDIAGCSPGNLEALAFVFPHSEEKVCMVWKADGYATCVFYLFRRRALKSDLLIQL